MFCFFIYEGEYKPNFVLKNGGYFPNPFRNFYIVLKYYKTQSEVRYMGGSPWRKRKKTKIKKIKKMKKK
jgi:hypothetical protein